MSIFSSVSGNFFKMIKNNAKNYNIRCDLKVLSIYLGRTEYMIKTCVIPVSNDAVYAIK